MINKKERENLQAIKIEKRNTFLRGKKSHSNVAILNEKQHNVKISILLVPRHREIPQVCDDKYCGQQSLPSKVYRIIQSLVPSYSLWTKDPPPQNQHQTHSFFETLAHVLEGCSVKSRAVTCSHISPHKQFQEGIILIVKITLFVSSTTLSEFPVSLL